MATLGARVLRVLKLRNNEARITGYRINGWIAIHFSFCDSGIKGARDRRGKNKKKTEYPRRLLSLRRVSREPRELISVSRAIHNGPERERLLLCVKEINRAGSEGLRVMEGFKEKERSTKELAGVARGETEESSSLRLPSGPR